MCILQQYKSLTDKVLYYYRYEIYNDFIILYDFEFIIIIIVDMKSITISLNKYIKQNYESIQQHKRRRKATNLRATD